MAASVIFFGYVFLVSAYILNSAFRAYKEVKMKRKTSKMVSDFIEEEIERAKKYKFYNDVQSVESKLEELGKVILRSKNNE